MKKRKLSFTSVGGSSILTIFAVLCFLVFALLSLSTAKANYNLSEKSVKAVSNYYAADTKAEEIYSQIRAGNMTDGNRKEILILTLVRLMISRNCLLKSKNKKKNFM